MKMKSVIFVLVCSFVILSGFVLAENCTSFNYSEWSSCNAGVKTRTVISSSPANCSGGNSFLVQNCTVSSVVENLTKVEKAFECLVNELKPDCSGATTVQQLSFAILASPDNITGKCVDQLLKKNKSEGCFGDSNNCGIKETAMAILALNHVGKNTTYFESWLTRQNKTASDVEWFLQQDSVGDVDCRLKYDEEDYAFSAKENKKLSGNVGPCFSFVQSNYWLRLDEGCFDKEFVMSCNKEFFAGWHYKSPISSILNVLSDTKRTAGANEVRLMVDSRCFGSGSGCNFEDTAWATLVLKNQLYDIKPYIPYLISAEDSNEEYFPAAFNYLILEYSSIYGNKIIQQQKNSQFWEAENSAYGSVYDTALALLAMGRQNQEQIKSAKDWVWNLAQDSNGCWNSRNIRDTAFVLWAIEQRSANIPDEIISPTTGCSAADFFCSTINDCTAAGGNFFNNYYCSGTFEKCCSVNPVKSCQELQGTICSGGLVCSGTVKTSSDGSCCLSNCVEPPSTTTECADEGNQCRDSCLTSQEEADFACSGDQICCARKETPEKKEIPLWIWILLAILILLIILAIVMRDRIKVWYYKRKRGSSKEDLVNNPASPRPPFGPPSSPRLGFPPLNRPMSRPLPPGQNLQRPPQRPPQGAPQSTQKPQDTFSKLKEMTK